MFSFFKKKAKPADAGSASQAAASGAVSDGGAPGSQLPEPAPTTSPIPSPLAAPIPPAPPAGPAASELAPSAEPVPTRSGWLARLKVGLRKTGSGIAQVFTGTRIDDALYEELESALLLADAGVPATLALLDDLKHRVKQTKAQDPAAVRNLLVDALAESLAPLQASLTLQDNAPTVVLVAGVNGAGKTTSIGKLTRHLAEGGQKVLLAAADTFRAAAREQLAVWGERNSVQIVSAQGADPSAVAFDAVQAGRARGCDVVIVDTAGRLPTQAHLMAELSKIGRTVAKALPGAPHEVLLVVDGNTGQNALAQVKAFDAALPLTGLLVTKLDGTAKGGVLAAIARWGVHERARPVPVYFIGVGEKLEDLQPFEPREFAQALVGA
jgi:fused signal recognition particle receptor